MANSHYEVIINELKELLENTNEFEFVNREIASNNVPKSPNKTAFYVNIVGSSNNMFDAVRGALNENLIVAIVCNVPNSKEASTTNNNFQEALYKVASTIQRLTALYSVNSTLEFATNQKFRIEKVTPTDILFGESIKNTTQVLIGLEIKSYIIFQ
jgi:hypothetical protein